MTIDIPISHSKDSGRVLSCPPSNQITDPCWLTPPSRTCGMVQLRISWNISWPVCTMRLRQWKCWNMGSMCWQWPSLQRFAKISWLHLPQNSALTVACKIREIYRPSALNSAMSSGMKLDPGANKTPNLSTFITIYHTWLKLWEIVIATKDGNMQTTTVCRHNIQKAEETLTSKLFWSYEKKTVTAEATRF